MIGTRAAGGQADGEALIKKCEDGNGRYEIVFYLTNHGSSAKIIRSKIPQYVNGVDSNLPPFSSKPREGEKTTAQLRLRKLRKLPAAYRSGSGFF